MPQQERPVNLNLFAFRFPVMAIVSIMHRITGVVLFIGLPVLIWAWYLSLRDAASFSFVASLLHIPLVRVFFWLYISCLAYHILAGLRHLLMDMGLGEELTSARRLSWGVLAVGIVCCIFFFYYLLVY